MTYTMKIAARYMRSGSSSKAVRAMTIISIVGIAIGVATLIITLSFADGFGKEYQRVITDFNAHVMLLSGGEIPGAGAVLKKLETVSDDITGIYPFLYREGLLIDKGEIRGIVLKGTNEDFLKNLFVDGKSFFGHGEKGMEGVVIGKFLAQELNIRPHDKIKVMLPTQWDKNTKGNFKEFVVNGIFESGMYDFDSQFLLMDLKDSQKIFNVQDIVTGVEIKLNDWRKSKQVAGALDAEFPYPMYSANFEELNKSLFDAVKLERMMFIIIMGAIVVVAAFNVIGTVMLKILYKTSDIAIFRALGMRMSDLKRVFVMQGVATGLVGTGIGVLSAVLLIWSVERFGWLKIPPEIYLLKTLPVCISWSSSVIISAFSLCVCYLTSKLASKKVLDLPIIRGLHRP